MGNRILLADSDPDFGREFKSELASHNLELLWSNDGDSALSAVSSRKPELLVTETMLPLLSGYELCQKLRNTIYGKSLPIIVVASSIEKEEILEFSKLNDSHSFYLFSL